ncbi:MAG: dockerin type I repeat-containing protein [Planctomycetota bacterium]
MRAFHGLAFVGFCLGLALVLTSTGRVSAVDFIRGDANNDGEVDLADASRIVGHLSGVAPNACLDAMDVNDDGQVDVGDLTTLYIYLFAFGPRPAMPFPECGNDDTADALVCEESICAAPAP